MGPDRHARDIESLDRYAMERWEVILHFMVGSPCAAVSQDLAQLLVQAGLMKRYTVVIVHQSTVGFYTKMAHLLYISVTFHLEPHSRSFSKCLSVLCVTDYT